MKVVLTEQAQRDMQRAHDWWAEHKSAAQAARWYARFYKAIATLSSHPERWSLSFENDQFGYEIRDLLYGLGGRPTHRAVFTVGSDTIFVLTVRHLAQQELEVQDLR